MFKQERVIKKARADKCWPAKVQKLARGTETRRRVPPTRKVT